MLHTQVLSNALLEFLHHGAIIGEPLVVENPIHTLQECIAITDIGAANMQWFSECRRGTIDGKV